MNRTYRYGKRKWTGDLTHEQIQNQKKSRKVPLLARESQKLERWLFLSPKVSAEWIGVTKNMKNEEEG